MIQLVKIYGYSYEIGDNPNWLAVCIETGLTMYNGNGVTIYDTIWELQVRMKP